LFDYLEECLLARRVVVRIEAIGFERQVVVLSNFDSTDSDMVVVIVEAKGSMLRDQQRVGYFATWVGKFVAWVGNFVAWMDNSFDYIAFDCKGDNSFD
jgi:hypothetical protein